MRCIDFDKFLFSQIEYSGFTIYEKDVFFAPEQMIFFNLSVKV